METKHTKGFWFACCKKARPHFVFTDDGETAICSIISKQDDETELPLDELQANAKLISAAPELLEALIGLMKVIKRKELNLGDLNPIEKAEEAINKAIK